MIAPISSYYTQHSSTLNGKNAQKGLEIHVTMAHCEHCNLRSIFKLFYVLRGSLAWSTDARLHAGQYASLDLLPSTKARPYWICRCILYDGWIIHQTKLPICDQKLTPQTGLQHSTCCLWCHVLCISTGLFLFFFHPLTPLNTSNSESERIHAYWAHLHAVLHLHPPAVDHHGPSIWRIACLYPPQESQDGGGVLGHSMVWPGHELELSYLSLLTGAILQGDSGKNKCQLELASDREITFLWLRFWFNILKAFYCQRCYYFKQRAQVLLL